MDLQIEETFTCPLGPIGRAEIVQVGAGGTGSALAPQIAKLLYVARQRGIPCRYVIVDHDRVEERNVGRQLFGPAEIGQNKAVALATRLSLAYGLAVEAHPHRFEPEWAERWFRGFPEGSFVLEQQGLFRLLVGCVDNAEARLGIALALTYGSGMGSRWWLDCGNGRDSGQVLLGNLCVPYELEGIRFDPVAGSVSGLPAPHVTAPDLLAPPANAAEAMSCADLALREEQSLTINAAVAAIAARYVRASLLQREVDGFETTLTTEPPAARTVPVTRRTIQAVVDGARPHLHKDAYQRHYLHSSSW